MILMVIILHKNTVPALRTGPGTAPLFRTISQHWRQLLTDKNIKINKCSQKLTPSLFFVEGKQGFATSIALVSAEGKTILGVVYDPINKNLYHTVKGQGVYINAHRYAPPAQHPSQPITLN